MSVNLDIVFNYFNIKSSITFILISDSNNLTLQMYPQNRSVIHKQVRHGPCRQFLGAKTYQQKDISIAGSHAPGELSVAPLVSKNIPII